MPRMTIRYISEKSNEFLQIKGQVKEQFHEDLFPPGLDLLFPNDDEDVELVETKDKNVVGFIIPNRHRGLSLRYNAYSLITHELIVNRSNAVAIKFVKSQAKSNA